MSIAETLNPPSFNRLRRDGLPAQQPHQKPRGPSRNRSEGGAFLTTDGGADCRRDACGCRYQKSFSFPRSAFTAAPEHDPCVHIHLYREISFSTSTPRSVLFRRTAWHNSNGVQVLMMFPRRTRSMRLKLEGCTVPRTSRQVPLVRRACRSRRSGRV